MAKNALLQTVFFGDYAHWERVFRVRTHYIIMLFFTKILMSVRQHQLFAAMGDVIISMEHTIVHATKVILTAVKRIWPVLVCIL